MSTIWDSPSTAERVREFLQTRSGLWFCDSCIADHLALDAPQEAARAVSQKGMFPRARGNCVHCGADTVVTTAAAL